MAQFSTWRKDKWWWWRESEGEGKGALSIHSTDHNECRLLFFPGNSLHFHCWSLISSTSEVLIWPSYSKSVVRVLLLCHLHVAVIISNFFAFSARTARHYGHHDLCISRSPSKFIKAWAVQTSLDKKLNAEEFTFPSHGENTSPWEICICMPLNRPFYSSVLSYLGPVSRKPQ